MTTAVATTATATAPIMALLLSLLIAIFFANQAALIPCIEASPHQRPFQIKYRPAVCSFSELYTTSFYDWISTDNHGGHPLSYKTPSADVPLKSTPAAHRLKNYCSNLRLFQPWRALTHFYGTLT